MNRSFDIFRMSANGMDPDRGTARMGQLRSRTNHSADPPFDHGVHAHDRDRDGDRDWGPQRQQRMQMPERDTLPDYPPRMQERAMPQRRREPSDRQRYERGIYEMHGYPAREPSREVYARGEPYSPQQYPSPSTYGNVPYDQMMNRADLRRGDVWRGRDEEHDFWGMDREPERDDRDVDGGHPSLWQRVKGAFSGKGPKNYQRSDERIHEDVCEHLTAHPYVDASDIEVIVRDGEVTLTGNVEARMVKRAAEECCEHVRGVHDVHNHLKVKRAESTQQPR